MLKPNEYLDKYPLHAAAILGNFNACQQLLREKNLVQKTDDAGKEAIFYACTGPETAQDTKIVRLLYEHGGRLTFDDSGKTHCLLDVAKSPQIKNVLKELISFHLQTDRSKEPEVILLLLLSFYQNIRILENAKKESMLNSKNLELLNSITISDEIYASAISKIFLNCCDGMLVIGDKIGFGACERVLKYHEQTKQVNEAAKVAYYMASYAGDFQAPEDLKKQAAVFYRKAISYYQHAGDEKLMIEVVSDYSAYCVATDDNVMSFRLDKKVLLHTLQNDPEEAIDKLDNLATSHPKTIYSILNELINEEEVSATALVENFRQSMVTELAYFGQMHSSLDREDLTIILALFTNLNETLQVELDDIKQQIMAILFPVPTLQQMIKDKFCTNNVTEKAAEYVLVPKAQFQFLRKRYQEEKTKEYVQSAKRTKEQDQTAPKL